MRNSSTNLPRNTQPRADTIPAGALGGAGATFENFVLWIDAVGGFLVCSQSRVSLGPADSPAGDRLPEIALWADLRPEHATIARDREGYVLAPSGPTSIDGRPTTGPVALVDGAVIGLGAPARLRFSRPHPLSASARLDIMSGHRTNPAVNAIVLAADTVLLGPDPRSHIVCRRWSSALTLYRRGDRWACLAQSPLEIDGQVGATSGWLTSESRIVGEEISLGLEPYCPENANRAPLQRDRRLASRG